MIEPKPNNTLVQLDKDTSIWIQDERLVIRNVVHLPTGHKMTTYVGIKLEEVEKCSNLATAMLLKDVQKKLSTNKDDPSPGTPDLQVH